MEISRGYYQEVLPHIQHPWSLLMTNEGETENLIVTHTDAMFLLDGAFLSSVNDTFCEQRRWSSWRQEICWKVLISNGSQCCADHQELWAPSWNKVHSIINNYVVLQLFTGREEFAIQFKTNSENFSIRILLCIWGTTERHWLNL